MFRVRAMENFLRQGEREPGGVESAVDETCRTDHCIPFDPVEREADVRCQQEHPSGSGSCGICNGFDPQGVPCGWGEAVGVGKHHPYDELTDAHGGRIEPVWIGPRPTADPLRDDIAPIIVRVEYQFLEIDGLVERGLRVVRERRGDGVVVLRLPVV